MLITLWKLMFPKYKILKKYPFCHGLKQTNRDGKKQ